MLSSKRENCGESSRRDFAKQCAATLALPVAAGLTSGASANEPAAGRPRIKIGQIGTGHAHASKLSVYRQSDDYEVIGVVESDAELRRRAESQNVYRDLPWMTQQQLLNVAGLQAVLVETRVDQLLDVAEACIAAGKHIHLDKPAGESLPQFHRLLDEAARQDLLVQMGYMYRYNPAIVMLRDLLNRDWLGKPFEVHAAMSKVVAPAERRALAQYPGGIMFELGCHLIDLVVGLLGKPERTTPFAQQSADAADSLVDNMLAVFEYPGAIATVKTTAVEVEGGQRRHLVLCGTEGTFHIQPLDNPAARLALAKPRGDFRAGYQDVAFPKYARYVDDAADMARVIRGEKPSDFSYQHDLAVQSAVLAASGVPGH